MTAEPDLLPCPFCGGTEIHIGPMAPLTGWEYWTVGCNNYDCPLDADSVKVEFGTPEKSAAAWNTRAADANLAQLQAEVDALRTRLEDTVRDSTNEIGALRAEVDALREALEEIRSRSAMNLAMNPDPLELTARLGDIYQIADAAL